MFIHRNRCLSSGLTCKQAIPTTSFPFIQPPNDAPSGESCTLLLPTLVLFRRSLLLFLLLSRACCTCLFCFCFLFPPLSTAAYPSTACIASSSLFLVVRRFVGVAGSGLGWMVQWFLTSAPRNTRTIDTWTSSGGHGARPSGRGWRSAIAERVACGTSGEREVRHDAQGSGLGHGEAAGGRRRGGFLLENLHGAAGAAHHLVSGASERERERRKTQEAC